MPAISIIIPIYNVEKYLEECLNSILNQTFADFEVLMVNDCSTDNSPYIIDEFSKRDKRFIAIHKPKNEGSFLARKTALEIAKGEYIACLDSDDFFKSVFLEKMFAKANENNYDMVWCLYENMPFYPEAENHLIKGFALNKNNAQNLVDYLQSKISPFTWDKLIKRDIFNKVIFYDIRLTAYEDVIIMLQIIFHMKNFALVEESLYVHRMHAESSTHKGITKEQEVLYQTYLVITINRLFGEIPKELLPFAQNAIGFLRRVGALSYPPPH